LIAASNLAIGAHKTYYISALFAFLAKDLGQRHAPRHDGHFRHVKNRRQGDTDPGSSDAATISRFKASGHDR
jgi:hypothetical protein